MTTEQKAKAYDEAQKWIESIYADLSHEHQMEAEAFFPELAESDDERIRKDIVFYIAANHKDDGEKARWLYWLEKQGDKPQGKSALEAIKEEKVDNQYCAKPIDKVKPIFNIGDVLCDKSCTTLNKEAQPNLEIVDFRNGLYICDKCSFPISHQDEYELVAKRIEPQPAWSEEDEKMLNGIIDEIEANRSDAPSYDIPVYEGYLNWLKSIKQRIGG